MGRRRLADHPRPEDVRGRRPRRRHTAAAAPVPVILARGEHDPMVSRDQLTALAPDAVDLPGLGHNAHVEDPAALLPLLTALR